MHPLLVIAAAAAAFWLGQVYLRRRAEGTLPWQRGQALPPLGTEVPTSPEGAANLEAWAAVDYDVDLFPGSAQRQWLAPPAFDDASIAPQCEAIAVGHGMWARIAEVAQQGYAAGRTDAQITVDALALVPALGRCIAQKARAAQLLAEEVQRRVAAGRIVMLQLVPSAIPGGLWMNPAPRRRTGRGRW